MRLHAWSTKWHLLAALYLRNVLFNVPMSVLVSNQLQTSVMRVSLLGDAMMDGSVGLGL
jgi:hypothetical protein